MKIIITGGTGFTGKRVLPLLQNKGQIRCITRNLSSFKLIEQYNFEPYQADIKNLNNLIKAFEGYEGLINICSLGFGDAPNIINACKHAGIKRAIFVSTTAIETKLNPTSKKIRIEAEKIIKNSNMNWTIIRPTMIYGDIDDRNIIKLIKFIKAMPFILVPGDGKSLQQPVYVEDVAKAIINAFFETNTYNKIFNISGEYPLNFNELIFETCNALKVNRKLLYIPIKPVIIFFKILEKLFKNPLIKSEQILRLLEDKNFSHEDARKDFNYTPISFKEGIQKEVQCLL